MEEFTEPQNLIPNPPQEINQIEQGPLIDELKEKILKAALAASKGTFRKVSSFFKNPHKRSGMATRVRKWIVHNGLGRDLEQIIAGTSKEIPVSMQQTKAREFLQSLTKKEGTSSHNKAAQRYFSKFDSLSLMHLKEFVCTTTCKADRLFARIASEQLPPEQQTLFRAYLKSSTRLKKQKKSFRPLKRAELFAQIERIDKIKMR